MGHRREGSLRRAVDGVMGAVPDSNWTILTLIEEADLVVCHNIWSGTYGGTIFRGVPTPEGKHFSVQHIHIYRMRDDRIAVLLGVGMRSSNKEQS